MDKKKTILSKKTAGLKPLRYLKYLILIVFVILLPLLVTNSIGMGYPFFCKYICPQGVLEGAIPLSLGNAAIRSALGKLFSFKCIILISVVVLSILFYRPFCKWICPLGAIYSLFNKISFLNISVDNSKCIGCSQCSKSCKAAQNNLPPPVLWTHRPKPAPKHQINPIPVWMIYISRRTSFLQITQMHGTRRLV